MQVRNDPDAKRRQARVGKEAGTRGGNVVSLKQARRRREYRERQARLKNAPPASAYDGVDVTGVDLDRLTPGARQLFWYDVTNYARHVYASASDAAIRESGLRHAPISSEHVQAAEVRRAGASSFARRRENEFGLGFVLDALQILGAATCGALATRPMALEAAGPWPLVTALTITVAIFIGREYLYAKYD